MDRPSTLAVATMSVLLLGASLPAGNADEQERTEQRSDGDQVNAAGQAFIAAIVARDISAMDKLWAHEFYATFVGPLSTKVVVGWEGSGGLGNALRPVRPGHNLIGGIARSY